MHALNPMFHMDKDYMWRWFTTSPTGRPLSISTRAFFLYEDAKRDFDAAQRRLDS